MKEQVLRLQELSNNSWPAKSILLLNGWIIRISEGITNRANSILPLRYCGSDLSSDIEHVEKIYLSHNLPIVFQIPDYFEPSNLLEELERRNYQSKSETIVMETDPHKMIRIDKNINYLYSVEDSLNEMWFQSLREFNKMDSSQFKGYKNIIERITLRKMISTAMKSGEIYGLMLGVIERSNLVVYSMVTHPNHRRKGIAKSILSEIGSWARNNDISRISLQVETENIGARNLFDKAGFVEVYKYRYLEKKNK